MNDLAIVALTPRGEELGRRLASGLGRGEVLSVAGSTRDSLQQLFAVGCPLVCIMALGIVVRILGPLARDKDEDPAIVVVDEAGRFAIAVLGGHGGGANALAQEVARALGATPVITTASDALGLPAVDLIGRAWGWQIERAEELTKLAAAVIRGEPIGIWQDAGRRDWWQAFGPWPPTFEELHAEELPFNELEGLLVISDRLLETIDSVPLAVDWGPMVIYRPPTLVLGVGCRRGVPCADIEAMFQDVCQDHGLSPLSLGVVATVSLKADEPGLQAFAAAHGLPLRCFSLEDLARVGPLPTPSETVRAKIGILGVAEPAALLAAGTDTLVMPKRRGPRITMALARRSDV